MLKSQRQAANAANGPVDSYELTQSNTDCSASVASSSNTAPSQRSESVTSLPNLHPSRLPQPKSLELPQYVSILRAQAQLQLKQADLLDSLVQQAFGVQAFKPDLDEPRAHTVQEFLEPLVGEVQQDVGLFVANDSRRVV